MDTQQVTKPRSRFELRLPPTERAVLHEVAGAEGRSASDLVRELIAERARRHGAIAARIFGQRPPDEASQDTRQGGA